MYLPGPIDWENHLPKKANVFSSSMEKVCSHTGICVSYWRKPSVPTQHQGVCFGVQQTRSCDLKQMTVPCPQASLSPSVKRDNDSCFTNLLSLAHSGFFAKVKNRILGHSVGISWYSYFRVTLKWSIWIFRLNWTPNVGFFLLQGRKGK